MTIALPFVLQILQGAPALIAALTPFLSHPNVTVVDSSGAVLSAAAIADLKSAAAAATASAVTGVQAAG